MSAKQADRDPTLYNDIFQILEVNPDGKKFDKGAALQWEDL